MAVMYPPTQAQISNPGSTPNRPWAEWFQSVYQHFKARILGDSNNQWQVFHEVIATASLPAAGASNNGRVVIEDNGTGDRNLVIYAGGQRFRIDGGAAF